MLRDYTYIDDIISGIISVFDHIPENNKKFSAFSPVPSLSTAPFVIYNLGNNHPEKLMFFIETLENILGKKAKKIFTGMQAGDVFSTMADIDDMCMNFGWKPQTSINEGLKKFTDWYMDYYK